MSGEMNGHTSTANGAPASDDWPGQAREAPDTSATLEARLAAAQAEGLEANLRRQLEFIGAQAAVFTMQTLGIREATHVGLASASRHREAVRG